MSNERETARTFPSALRLRAVRRTEVVPLTLSWQKARRLSEAHKAPASASCSMKGSQERMHIAPMADSPGGTHSQPGR
jgi:hypothetical protein